MSTGVAEALAAQTDAVVRAVARIAPSEFEAYAGGWPDEVGTALLDAVFSMQARYYSATPGLGVYGRLQTFRETHPGATNDLRTLVTLGADGIRAIMGNSKSHKRYKAACVVEAAQALLALTPPVATAAQARDTAPENLKRAYTSVAGLGWITSEYFQMLLGTPGVKADVMVERFVNAALTDAKLNKVDNRTARELVIAAHAHDPRSADLTAFEHAIWRTKGALPQ